MLPKLMKLLLLNGLQQTLMFVVIQDGLKWVMDMAPHHVSTVTMMDLLMMAMIFLTMMGMVLRVVGMVMALLVLSLTMMAMVLTTAMAPTIAMVLMTVIVHLKAAKAMVHLIV